jgi:hypothetical protein
MCTFQVSILANYISPPYDNTNHLSLVKHPTPAQPNVLHEICRVRLLMWCCIGDIATVRTNKLISTSTWIGCSVLSANKTLDNRQLWAAGSPNGNVSENYIMLSYGFWDDVSPNNTRWFICELKPWREKFQRRPWTDAEAPWLQSVHS